jgi:hypothetical protein
VAEFNYKKVNPQDSFLLEPAEKLGYALAAGQFVVKGVAEELRAKVGQNLTVTHRNGGTSEKFCVGILCELAPNIQFRETVPMGFAYVDWARKEEPKEEAPAQEESAPF